MVYPDQPVKGAHLGDQQEANAATKPYFAQLLGVKESVLRELSLNDGGALHPTHPTLAIHARLIQQYMPQRREVTFRDVQEALEAKGITAPPSRELCLYFGLEETAGTKFDHGKAGLGRANALFESFLTILNNTRKPKVFYNDFLKMVKLEAKLRGIKNLKHARSWETSALD